MSNKRAEQLVKNADSVTQKSLAPHLVNDFPKIFELPLLDESEVPFVENIHCTKPVKSSDIDPTLGLLGGDNKRVQLMFTNGEVYIVQRPHVDDNKVVNLLNQVSLNLPAETFTPRKLDIELKYGVTEVAEVVIERVNFSNAGDKLKLLSILDTTINQVANNVPQQSS